MPIRAQEPACFPDNLLAGLVGPGALPDDALLADDRPAVAVPEDFICPPHGASDRLGWSVGAGDAEPDARRAWWIMHTKPRQEKSLARDLLQAQIPYYLPQVPKTSSIRGRKYVSYVPVFTSYVFVFGNNFERHFSLTTNRIAGYLSVPNGDELTRQLFDLSRLIGAGVPMTVEGRLKAGDRVRVKSGSLAGVEGTVLARCRKCRLIVAVNLLQQGVSVEIDDHLLEPIELARPKP